MKIGVPREVKDHEYRVGMIPATAHALVDRGHEVVVERGAGLGSGIEDGEYVDAGAHLLDSADEVFGAAEMIVKVKEPVAEEYDRLQEG